MEELNNFGYFDEDLTISLATLEPKDSDKKIKVVNLTIETSENKVEAFLTASEARRLAKNLIKMSDVAINGKMTFTQIGRTMGDETTPYKVTDYSANTIIEFINEVLEEKPREWGYFEINTKDGGILGCQRIEYDEGELKEEIPDEWQYVFIESVEAVGGWSRMDYYITTKE